MTTIVSLGYLKKIFYDQRYILLVLFLFGLLFEFSWVLILYKSDIGSFVDNYANLLPQSIMNMLGIQTGSSLLNSQIMAFGYGHPLILISMAFLPISIPARYIAGEIENKTFDILLTKPVNRRIIPICIFLFLLTALGIQSGALFAGTWIGSVFFELPLPLTMYFKICLVGYIFYLSMACISLSIACWNQERGKSLAGMITIVVVLYFFDAVIRMVQSWEYMTNFSYFQLYQPTQLTLGKAGFLSSGLVSFFIMILFFFTSMVQINRRDL